MKSIVFESINPANGEVLSRFPTLTNVELDRHLQSAEHAFATWHSTSISQRCEIIRRIGTTLVESIHTHAALISREMGKPIVESVAEIRKSAGACEYYAQNAEQFLQDECIQTEAMQSFVRHDPLGAVLAIMPWNFPYWQVIRCAIPALAAGNVVLLKHAPNVQGCAQALVDSMHQAGLPEGVMQVLCIHHDDVPSVMQHPLVQAVSFTGSTRAGAVVASHAGANIKKSVLELGGSNAFVVWSDAKLDHAVNNAVIGRMANTGQSCISAKRFIVHVDLVERFTQALLEKVQTLVVGDPLDERTQIGPLARVDLAQHLEQQVKDSLAAGAELLLGGKRNQAWFEPTILTKVAPGMRVFDEETFGPLACITTASTVDEAMELAMNTKYGLGMSVFTSDVQKALSYADRVPDGFYAINTIVKSDARLPFGGTRQSGYGRELSKDGLMEFVNRKTVVVHHPT
ncbi:MAG: NAD-dependent succinate-semialdehyde dehydrogenase [Bradyrhizobiaceae bacterium]|nr:NAD-dependent succinate-semialdehyde dehydrogenase [Bradyrhizobiaceae bacterium]